jgi:hypothetical protein
MAFTMTHKEIANELADKEMGHDSTYWTSSYRPDLQATYNSYTEENLLEALERYKAWLGTSDVDDLISAAKKNVELYYESFERE